MSTPVSATRPNVVIILADDMGFSDIGCYGSEIPTPNIDALAAGGVRMTQFYNTARCSPSRASLLTGLHPHQTGIGILTRDDHPGGYAGTMSQDCATFAEVLGAAGYGTYLSGKWHVTGHFDAVDETWPIGRGFDHFYGTGNGGGNYYAPTTLTVDERMLTPEERPDGFYYTDQIAEHACGFVTDHVQARPDDPFVLYVAFTAPHWPLHAPAEQVAEREGDYDEGWDVVRARRWQRQQEGGWFGDAFTAAPRDPANPAWEDAPDHAWQSRRMEVYAAQVARMDAGIGRLLATLDEAGIADDTLVMFLSDNGGCAEEIPPGGFRRLPFGRETADGRPIAYGNVPDITPGPEDTFMSYGRVWANVSNTPFREYKHWVHEGGISTPLVARWPGGGLAAGQAVAEPHQLPDIMATLLEASGAAYPEVRDGHQVPPAEGVSMLPTWRGTPTDADERYLYWEHEGNAAIRRGRWKLVRKYPGPWELYDLAVDRAELVDLAAEQREIVVELAEAWTVWSRRVGVIPREVWESVYPVGNIPGDPRTMVVPSP